MTFGLACDSWTRLLVSWSLSTVLRNSGGGGGYAVGGEQQSLLELLELELAAEDALGGARCAKEMTLVGRVHAAANA
jgi:hypothetical protein